MAEVLQIEITGDERKTLLRGLRFVRSSIMLEARDPTPEDKQSRADQLRQVQQIVDRLNQAPSVAEV